MATKSTYLTDHEDIRRWVEERGGHPAAVRGTGAKGDPGVLRLDFPDGDEGEERLEHVSWDDWFRKFDESDLALVVQGQSDGRSMSRFNKLVSRDTANDTSNVRPKRG